VNHGWVAAWEMECIDAWSRAPDIDKEAILSNNEICLALCDHKREQLHLALDERKICGEVTRCRDQVNWV
jgi:hypothetical protein